MIQFSQVNSISGLSAVAMGVALTAGVAVTPTVCADVEIGATTNVRRGPDPFFSALLANSLPANFLDIRPDHLYVGLTSAGELRLFDGGLGTGVLQNVDGFVGHDAAAVGKVTVEGGAIWNNDGALTVGRQGNGTLDIKTGGQVFATTEINIGDQADSMGAVTVDGTGSMLTITNNDLSVGKEGTGTLDITAGGVVKIRRGRFGDENFSTGTVNVEGMGSRLELEDFLEIGNSAATGTLNIANGGVVEITEIGPGSTEAIRIGVGGSNQGTVTVDGAGSKLDATRGAIEISGLANGRGELNITGGGVVLSTSGRINNSTIETNGSLGTALVDGVGSQWNLSGTLDVGDDNDTGGDGILTVSNGGVVSAENVFIRRGLNLFMDEIFGTVNVHSGGILRIKDQFGRDGVLQFVGGTVIFEGDRTYDGTEDRDNVNAVLKPRGGVLSNGENLRIEGALAALDLITINGGSLSATSISNIVAVELQKGLLELTGVGLDVTDPGQLGDTVSLNGDQHLKIGQAVHVFGDGRIDLDGGRLGGGSVQNDGLILGDGRIDGPLDNTANGEVRVSSGQTLRFTGAGHVNHGDINILGAADLLTATVEFDQDLTNSSTGTISGRGTLIANGGLTNEGEMLFSGGFSDVFGDVAVTSGALVRVDGSAVATFHDDVDNQGTIQTNADSQTVFLGIVTGSGVFSSNGTVIFEDVFSPGNSPGQVVIEGDAAMGASATLELELGGLTQGHEYDHIDIAGLFTIDGTVDIQLLNGFTPRLGDTFDVFDFESITGTFTEVSLPTLDHGLAIDVTSLLIDGTVSVVPEPGSAVFVLGVLGMLAQSRRRN